MLTDETRAPEVRLAALHDFAQQEPGKTSGVRVSYRDVGKEEAGRLEASTGLSGMEGYRHSIDGSTIRHILNEHGDPDTEAVRGQEAVTRDDIARLPEVVGNPDRVIRGEPKRGLERIKYEKRYNSTTYVVEEVRTGAEELATVTMYKQKGGGSGALGATDESGPSGVLHTSAPESESDAPFPGQPPSGNTASEGEGSSTDLAQTSELSEPARTELARRRMDARARGAGVQASRPRAAADQQQPRQARTSEQSGRVPVRTDQTSGEVVPFREMVRQLEDRAGTLLPMTARPMPVSLRCCGRRRMWKSPSSG